MRSHARGATATIARPGGAASAFCEAATTMSKPHSSIRNSLAARPLTESTTVYAPYPSSAAASAAMSFCAPVEVSLCVSSTPSNRRAPASSSRARSAAGSVPLPHGVSSTSTSQPKLRAIAISRCPKTPIGQARTRSPGPNRFPTAASRPPVPDEPRTSTSACSVPKTGRSRAAIRSSSALNSGPRWSIIGRALAASTDSATVTGPGMNSKFFDTTLSDGRSALRGVFDAMLQTPGTRVRLTSLSACAGCAAKVPASELALALRGLPAPTDPNVLVGISTSDDAGVYRLTDELAIVQTVDFFTPIVDDPYDFGRIAAANAISDIYAMGGTPVSALNIVAFPVASLGIEVLAAILAGGAAVASEARVSILGGHTIKSDEPKYGMAVTGTIHPQRIVTNGEARPGDLLLLTKPVGTGILTTAHKRDLIDDRGLAGAMARASGVALAIDAHAVPLFDGVLELIARDVIPGGTLANLGDHKPFVHYADGVETARRVVLSDAQTSGGLLIAIPRYGAERMLADLRDLGTVAIVGEVLDGPSGTIFVR